MKVKIKLSEGASLPKYSKIGDAGMDLTAISKVKQLEGIVAYGTGISVEIPVGFMGLILPRSSVYKYELSLANSVGVIDSGYRGEIIVKFRNTDWTGENNSTYDVGDRIAQLIIIPYPQVEFTQVDELSETERGTGGFGSTNSL